MIPDASDHAAQASRSAADPDMDPAASSSPAGSTPPHEAARTSARQWMAEQLLTRAGRDRAVRVAHARGDLDAAAVAAQDADNLRFLAPLIARHGWLDSDMVGREAAHACWLLAQHAPAARRAAWEPLLRQAAQHGRADLVDMAHLHDRVAVDENRPQTYATATISYRGQPTPRLWPVLAPATVNERRAVMGLPALPNAVLAAAWQPAELAERRGWPLAGQAADNAAQGIITRTAAGQ